MQATTSCAWPPLISEDKVRDAVVVLDKVFAEVKDMDDFEG